MNGFNQFINKEERIKYSLNVSKLSLIDHNHLINVENAKKYTNIINSKYNIENLFGFNKKENEYITEYNRVKLELREIKINSIFNMKRRKNLACFKILKILKKLFFIY